MGGKKKDMTTDLVTLIGSDTRLKKVAGTRGGEWHGPCPFCGGQDRFIVQPNYKGGRFYCRRCGASGDAIEYLRKRDGVGYREACERLGETPKEMSAPRSQQRARPAAPPLVSPESEWLALTDSAWQSAAGLFVEQCEDALHSDQGEKARAYLAKRGIPAKLQTTFQLGYNATNRKERWGEADVWLPRGIVIPWRIDGVYWRVNIRRPAGDPKYIQPRGCANGLYGVDFMQPGYVAMLVEGELDALSVRAGAPDMVRYGDVVPLATGSNTGAHLLRWVAKVALARVVFLAFDDDPAGEAAANWWANLLGPKALRLKPTRHDVNEMLTAGDDLEEWIYRALQVSWGDAESIESQPEATPVLEGRDAPVNYPG